MNEFIDQVRKIRDTHNIPLKKPVKNIWIISQNKQVIEHFKHFEEVIKENCNAFEIQYEEDESQFLMYEKNYTTSYKKKLGEIIRNLFAEENEKVNAKLKEMRDELKKLEDLVKKEREA